MMPHNKKLGQNHSNWITHPRWQAADPVLYEDIQHVNQLLCSPSKLS